jgi:hypothetical protein
MASTAGRLIAVLACVVAVVGVGSQARGKSDGPQLDFVVGDYALVGREPDGGAACSGSATIARDGDVLRLQRRVDGKEIAAEGRFETPSPPGEGTVLRFRWQDPAPTTMTCLVDSDLDNHARLSCVWLADGSQPTQPGLEAMFPTAVWERDAPRD